MASPEIQQENIQHTLSLVDEVVRRCPDRLMGSRSCNEAARIIAEHFERHCDPGSVKCETFTCHPEAFLRVIKGSVILYLFALAAVWMGRPLWSLLSLLVALALWLCQVLLYLQVFDVFFPRKTGTNVFGSVEPAGQVRQQVIISGHHDAPYVFNYLDWSPKHGPLFATLGILTFAVGELLSVSMLVTGFGATAVPVVMTAGLFFVLPLWWFTSDKVSPGAGDNMVAPAMANEMVRLFADRKKSGQPVLEHTRIICLSLDGEECGLRGSRAFVRAHAAELQATKTYVFNIDTVYHADKLSFLVSDLNRTVTCSRVMAEELSAIAQGLGYQARTVSLPFGAGSTDAATFAKAGVEATTLVAFNMALNHLDKDLVYHTPRDTSAAIEPAAVSQCLHVIREYLLKKDREYGL